MKGDALPFSGWLACLLAPVLCGPWGQGCVDLACTGVLGSGGDTQMPRGHCRGLPGGAVSCLGLRGGEQVGFGGSAKGPECLDSPEVSAQAISSSWAVGTTLGEHSRGSW